MQFNSSLSTGGFGSEIPGQIDALRKSAPPTLMKSLFNASPYVKQRITPQQSTEMTTQIGDQHRSAVNRQANEMDRDYGAANEQMKFQQLGSATNNAMQSFGNAQRAQQNALEQMMQRLNFAGQMFNPTGSMMGGLFGAG